MEWIIGACIMVTPNGYNHVVVDASRRRGEKGSAVGMTVSCG